jgi:hypothetical protein
MFASFAAARARLRGPTAAAALALLDALEAQQREWIFRADCFESSDSLGNMRSQLYAAGQLDALEKEIVQLVDLAGGSLTT